VAQKVKPAAFRAEVEVFGAKQSAEALRNMGERAYNTGPLMVELLLVLADSQRERMKTAPWAALKENTVERKAEQGEITEIFRDESRPIKGSPTRVPDALYNAITVPGAPGQLRHTTRTWAVFGVQSAGKGQLFYARFVQNVRGTRRKILAISEETALTVAERTASYVYSGWTLSPHMTLPG
jgi:hypothetical protein